ncbi:MAG: EamA family transporter [Candidatus Egerieousia sp.]
MYRLVLLSIVQSTFLVAGQIFLKLALAKIDKMSFTWHCIKQLLTNLHFLFCGLCMAAATVLWFYILRHFPFSAAYPLISISYVLGTVASVLIFHEQIPAIRYVGIALIIAGVVLIAQK